jgi:NADPH:quinone reductase-like Zn-dependent oxidoreductase
MLIIGGAAGVGSIGKFAKMAGLTVIATASRQESARRSGRSSERSAGSR